MRRSDEIESNDAARALDRELVARLQSFSRTDIPRPEGFVGNEGSRDQIDELALVAGLRERRPEAVQLLLERYRSLFFHCIGHFESDASAREDLHQDVVLYVLERLDQGSFDAEKGSLGTWLYRVAWCRCVDLKRKAGTRKTPRLTPVGDKVPERADAGPGPSEEAGTEEIGELVRRAMGGLEEEERQLLLLRFVEGQTIGEIGAALGISQEQTKYRLKRAATSLRRVLLNDLAIEEAVR